MTDSTLKIKRGDTWQQRFDWVQASNNLPVNLSNCTAKMDIVAIRGNEVAISISTASSPSVITIDGPNGIVTLRVEADDTADLKPGEYKTDLQITFPDGTVLSTDTFFIKIIEDVPR